MLNYSVAVAASSGKIHRKSSVFSRRLIAGKELSRKDLAYKCFCIVVITHADDSRGSKPFIRVCPCVCVRMIKPKPLELQPVTSHKICHTDRSSRILANHVILGQKSRSQGECDRMDVCMSVCDYG